MAWCSVCDMRGHFRLLHITNQATLDVISKMNRFLRYEAYNLVSGYRFIDNRVDIDHWRLGLWGCLYPEVPTYPLVRGIVCAPNPESRPNELRLRARCRAIIAKLTRRIKTQANSMSHERFLKESELLQLFRTVSRQNVYSELQSGFLSATSLLGELKAEDLPPKVKGASTLTTAPKGKVTPGQKVKGTKKVKRSGPSSTSAPATSAGTSTSRAVVQPPPALPNRIPVGELEEVEQDIQILSGLQATLETTTGAKLDEFDDPMEEESEDLSAFDFDYGNEENIEAQRLGYEAFKAKFWGPNVQPE